MAIKYAFICENHFLRVIASGKDDDLEQVQEYGMAVIKAAVENDASKVLCDERELEYTLGTFDTYESARIIAEAAPNIVKVAIVCKSENIGDAKFWETVATNRGLHIRIFNNIEDAQAWLS